MICARCHHDGPTILAYWGHELCPDCCRFVADWLDRHDRWPPVPWDETEATTQT